MGTVLLFPAFSSKAEAEHTYQSTNWSESQLRLMLIWNGAVVPSYQKFFEELSKKSNLTVISPKGWIHGSTYYSSGPVQKGYRFLATHFWFPQTSHYIIPYLTWYCFRCKPTHIYLMDELDRLSTLLHILFVRLVCRTPIITYSLQNIKKPKYYKWYHHLLLKLNGCLVTGVIAATNQSRQILESHGIQKCCAAIPLGVSQDYFHPGDKLFLREKYNIPNEAVVVLHAGSLHPSKGVNLLLALPRQANALLFLVGSGPLEKTIEESSSPYIKHWAAMPGEQLREIYQMADYVVLASISTPNWMEQIGRSLLEGILCGAVALGSRSGNIPNITLFPETLFEENSLESLRSLWTSLPLKNHLTLQKRQFQNVLENYTWSIVAANTLTQLKRFG